jgi:hypothetical protein
MMHVNSTTPMMRPDAVAFDNTSAEQARYRDTIIRILNGFLAEKRSSTKGSVKGGRSSIILKTNTGNLNHLFNNKDLVFAMQKLDENRLGNRNLLCGCMIRTFCRVHSVDIWTFGLYSRFHRKFLTLTSHRY